MLYKSLNYEKGEYLTIYGNVAFGNSDNILSDNFRSDGQLEKSISFCPKCAERFTDKILGYFYGNGLID